ncbi:MAG: GNAT family N-acetyltransferase [Waddliaceae bacterium]
MPKIRRLLHFFVVTIFLSLGAGQTAQAILPLDTAPRHEHSRLSKPHFESASPEDREFLILFAVRSNDIYHTRTASEEVARMVFDIPDSTFNTGFVEVLKLDQEIVGFFSLAIHENEKQERIYKLEHLFVKAGLQGKGYGTRLFQRVVEIAGRERWKRLEWISDPDATGFYLKMGATIIDYCENLLNPGVDVPIFEYDTTATRDEALATICQRLPEMHEHLLNAELLAIIGQ